MIFILLCILFSIHTQWYSIKEIVPGDTESSLNLLFQGNVDISYYDISTSSVCSMPLEKVAHYYLHLYQKKFPIGNTPNDYLISQAYRTDYYLNPIITNNPNSLNTDYVLDCKGDDPYKCFPKTFKTIKCVFGLRLSTYSVISLKYPLRIDYGFDMEYSFIMNSGDEVITLFHTSNINTLYNDYVSNGNSVSFALGSFDIRASIDSGYKLALEIYTISPAGSNKELVTYSNIIKDTKLHQVYLKIEYKQNGIEECFSRNDIIIKRIGGENTSFFLKVSINHQIIACICLDIMTIVTSNSINISFIGKSNVNLLLLSSIVTQSYDTHCSITNKSLQCGSSSNSIIVQNISQFNRETIAFLYSYNNFLFQFCKSTNALISIDSSYQLGLNACTYTVQYDPNHITELHIKNNQITWSLNKLYPIKLPQIFFPKSLYNLCVNSQTILFDVGYCSCEICLKTMELSSTYHQTNQCLSRYNSNCNCFDQSLITPLSPFPFSMVSILLCTECYINTNCSLNNKNGKCKIIQSGNASIINNDPTIISSASKYLNTNIIYGLCDCGAISSYSSINGILQSYLVYYDKSNPLVLSQEMISCIDCLYDASSISGLSPCFGNCVMFQIDDIEAYHVPFGGFQCTSCVMSSELIQVIKSIAPFNYAKLEECIEKYPETFYSDCMPVIKTIKYPSNQIFSGLLTHFRVECPGRRFEAEGSVCIPWYGFNNISFYTLIYKKTKNNAQWEDNFQCLNDQCEPASKSDCSTNLTPCVCYDSCPIGKGKYFNNISIPCSGNGVCTNQMKCICDPGYIEPSCEHHCSATLGGCCIDDSDCLHNASLHTCKKNINGNVGYCSN